ncbi:hypothetical protein AQPE_2903 [Aquipluma nitroreducens]|uniref:Uncharacterized protein n=1 Tax=Aquipluma nitroreducens TaxID=2010828 RepID=A0A5K7SAY1_9BACT|nr:hypothetical protein [Aquipluma nitroreducens]BBE18738.1 hypothetical protein AQPE_2903 [Aquipluma nitroreducens]
MKKIILSIAVVLISLVSMAQKPEYYQTMGESLGEYANCKGVADFQALGNKFEMIANVEKTEWLPLYYHAHCYILMSFMEQDAAKKDSYLDVAEKSVNKLIEMAPTEAEVFVLQAFYLTGRLVVNPVERGQEYSGLVGQANGKALAIDPSNPRAKMMKIQMDMGAAPYMGLDPKSFCPQAKELLASWDNFKPKSPLYPNWGKDQVAGIVKRCE